VSRPWVLVSDGGNGRSRDAVAAVRALAAAGYRPAVTVPSGSWMDAPSRHVGRRIRLPRAEDPGFAAAIRAELACPPYLTFLPASESALLAMGTDFVHLLDKAQLPAAAEAAGLSVPPQIAFPDVGDLHDAAGSLRYPVVVKPTVRRYWAFRADSAADLLGRAPEDGPVVVQPFLDDPLGAISGVVWRGELVAAAHERWIRIWPRDCGLACAAMTVPPDRDLEDRLIRLLQGYEGIFCAQLAGRHLLDVNLRVHSSHPLAMAGGVNLVGLLCDLLDGRDVAPVRARPGAFFRWIEGDLRHLGGSVLRGDISLGDAARALRPVRGTAHSLESVTDPWPMTVRVLDAVGRRLRPVQTPEPHPSAVTGS
jgi:predicted ATP-grasp superfamily ATP-dependent carboligase